MNLKISLLWISDSMIMELCRSVAIFMPISIKFLTFLGVPPVGKNIIKLQEKLFFGSRSITEPVSCPKSQGGSSDQARNKFRRRCLWRDREVKSLVYYLVHECSNLPFWHLLAEQLELLGGDVATLVLVQATESQLSSHHHVGLKIINFKRKSPY